MALALAALAAVEPACGSRYQQLQNEEESGEPEQAAGDAPPPYSSISAESAAYFDYKDESGFPKPPSYNVATTLPSCFYDISHLIFFIFYLRNMKKKYTKMVKLLHKSAPAQSDSCKCPFICCVCISRISIGSRSGYQYIMHRSVGCLKAKQEN
uniref:Isoform 2 of NEDD4 family-interacting protein 1 n=1 Tax=Homo sapiens TaxID=9606 RepID=Q9BT67-2|nr:unnamed protein product [Homo sapiens]